MNNKKKQKNKTNKLTETQQAKQRQTKQYIQNCTIHYWGYNCNHLITNTSLIFTFGQHKQIFNEFKYK